MDGVRFGRCKTGSVNAYLDVDPFLLRKRLVFVHEDTFRHV